MDFYCLFKKFALISFHVNFMRVNILSRKFDIYCRHSVGEIKYIFNFVQSKVETRFTNRPNILCHKCRILTRVWCDFSYCKQKRKFEEETRETCMCAVTVNIAIPSQNCNFPSPAIWQDTGIPDENINFPGTGCYLRTAHRPYFSCFTAYRP